IPARTQQGSQLDEIVPIGFEIWQELVFAENHSEAPEAAALSLVENHAMRRSNFRQARADFGKGLANGHNGIAVRLPFLALNSAGVLGIALDQPCVITLAVSTLRTLG